MTEVFCLAGLLFAQWWGGSAQIAQVPDGGTVIIGAMKFQTGVGKVCESPILAKIPYVSRLFTTVGYSSSNPRNSVIAGTAATCEKACPVQPLAVDMRLPVTPPFPPIKPGERATCDDAPDQQEILRALPRFHRGTPYLYDVFRDDIEFTVEKLVDRIDAPRFYPLVGPAQLHHCHWKCTVYFTEYVESTYPFPFRMKKRRAEVVYIDKDRLQPCANAPVIPAAEICCAGGQLGRNEVAKKSEPQQVQFAVVVGVIDRNAVPDATYHWTLKQLGLTSTPGTFGIVKNRAVAYEWLHALSTDGYAKVLAEPRLVTLSGQSGSILTGGEVPIVTTDSAGLRHVSYKPIGTQVSVLPTVTADGKIRLEVDATVTSVDKNRAEADDNEGMAAFSTQRAKVTAILEPGQTLIVGGLTEHEITKCCYRNSLLAYLPVIGDCLSAVGHQNKKRDLIVVISPEVVGAANMHVKVKPMPTRDVGASQCVASPDILFIDVTKLQPRGEYRLEPAEDVYVEITNAYPWQNLSGKYTISPQGCVDLGQVYGNICVAGRNVSEAEHRIRDVLAPIMKKSFEVRVVPVVRGIQNIRGEHLIRPDGTISLGTYGSVHVAGMTTVQVKHAVERHLEKYLVEPQVSVEVFAYNAKKTRADDGAAESSEPRALPTKRAAAELHSGTGVLAFWENQIVSADNTLNPQEKMPMLVGRVMVMSKSGDTFTEARGPITVTLFDMAGGAPGTKLAVWQLDPENLKRLQSEDRIGLGYTLHLPWEGCKATVKNVRLQVEYAPTDGTPHRICGHDMTLDHGLAAALPVVKDAPKATPATLSVSDVVKLTCAGAMDDIIIRQIELTNTTYRLTTPDLLFLLESGVSHHVIRVMQERREGAIVPAGSSRR